MRRGKCLGLILLVFILGLALRAQAGEFQVDLDQGTEKIDIPADTTVLKLKSGRFTSIFVRTSVFNDVSYIIGSADPQTIKNTKYKENPLNFFDPHFFMNEADNEEFIDFARTMIKTGRVKIDVKEMSRITQLTDKYQEAINVELLPGSDSLKERAVLVKKGDVVKISGLLFKLDKEFIDDTPFTDCPYVKELANFLYLSDLKIISRMDGPLPENSGLAESVPLEPKLGNPVESKSTPVKNVLPVMLVVGFVLMALALVVLLKK